MVTNDYHKIMAEITSGLTGNPTEDMEYLMKKSDEYKTHELAKEILRGIGRLMYDIIPEDKKENLVNAMKNDSLGWQATLEEVDFCIFKKDYRKARILIEALIEKLEDANLYDDDEVSVYKDFGETFEDVLFLFRNKPEKVLRAPSFPYAGIYLKYGSLLFELHEHAKAIDALHKAMEWNPIKADITFELAENYKVMGDIETFYIETRKAHVNCYRPYTLARYYRNLAYYFSEMKKFREAAACIMVSGSYDNTAANYQSELYYIQEMNGGVRINLDHDEIKALLEKEGITLGPDQDILGLSFSLAKDCLDKKEMQGAEYFLTIFYDLTGDEETGELLEAVRKALSHDDKN